MKKILSLIALLVVTFTAFAETTSEKIIPDGTQPNGGTITPKAITVDWATQKIVANVDLTNCLTGTNEQIFAISTNSADIANWDQESGSTLHFFYRQNFTDWGATTADVHKFAVQYRYKGDSGATNRFYEVKDISNCTIVMDKEGVHIDGTLVFEASLMPNLYKEGANQLYFGSLRGEHPYATYKSVELVTEGGSTPGETATYEFTNNVETVYWKEIAEGDYLDFHQYVKDAKLQLVKELDGTYTATLKDVVVGEDRVSLGDIVIAGLKATENAGTLQIDVPESNITISAPGSPYDGKSMIIKGGMIDATPAADADSKGSASVKLTILVGNGDMISYEFSDDVYVPNIYNFTSNAYVKAGDEVTNFENAQAVLTEYMDGVYMVKFKKLTLGTKTDDFTIENLKPTKGEDGNITFTTPDASGFWNDADETELNFTDFSASVKVGENGFEGFVCKFTTENGQFVYGEKAETPEPPSVVETKIFSDKLNYTFRGTIGTNDPQKLTIESLGNDRYNVILANLNSVNVLSVNVGTISFKNVAGKTENGITTIEVANPEVTFTDTDQELVDSKKGNLKVMFNNDKAYLNASGAVKIVSFGMSFDYTLVYGTEFSTEEPKDDYAINFDKDAKQTHSSRYSTSVSLQQTGKDKQTIEFGKTMNGYEDLTAGTKKFTVEAGSEVTPSIGYVGEWMHGYVYIDLNNDKQFSFNADGADQTGTEVVSYSYYKDQNSKGEAASSNCNVNPMPAFTAPTEPGTYRIRFKVDWDNIDAGGSAVSGNHILNNGGGIYDATLEVVTPVVDGISTINAEAANGVQFFTVDGVKLSKLQKGLNIVRTADGKVKKVLVK
ncbi:hypothetical protein [Leyella stercorea]